MEAFLYWFFIKRWRSWSFVSVSDKINKHTHSARNSLTASLCVLSFFIQTHQSFGQCHICVEQNSSSRNVLHLIHSRKNSNDIYDILPVRISWLQKPTISRRRELQAEDVSGQGNERLPHLFMVPLTRQNLGSVTHPFSVALCIIWLIVRRTCNRFIEYQTTSASNHIIYLYSVEFLLFGRNIQSTYKHLRV